MDKDSQVEIKPNYKESKNHKSIWFSQKTNTKGKSHSAAREERLTGTTWQPHLAGAPGQEISKFEKKPTVSCLQRITEIECANENNAFLSL